MKTIFFLIIMISSSTFAECQKKIKVQTFEKKLNIDSIKKEDNSKTYKEEIYIKCELYNKVNIGDTLYSEENERSIQNKGFLFFPEIIKKRYKILEK